MSLRIAVIVVALLGILLGALALLDEPAPPEPQSELTQTPVTPSDAFRELVAIDLAADADYVPDYSEQADARLAELIGDCTYEKIDAYGQYVQESLREAGEDIATRLAAADDARLVLAAAMIGDAGERSNPPGQSSSHLRTALEMAPADPLVLWQAAHYCEPAEQTAAYCDDPARIANSASALERNGAYWSIAAGSRYLRNDPDGALRLLERGVSAPDFDFYYADQVVLLERAIAAAGNLPYRLRVVEGLAVLAGQPRSYGIYKACRVESVADDGWMRACEAYAGRLAREGDTLMEQQMGRLLRRSLHEIALGGTSDSTPRETLANDLLDNKLLASPIGQLVTQWMLVDDGYVTSWVDELTINGEAAAFNGAIREAIRRGVELGLNPCTFAGIEPGRSQEQ